MTNHNYRTNKKSLIMSSNTKRKINSISLSLFSDVSLLLLKISASLCCISLIIPSVYGKKIITNIILVMSCERKYKWSSISICVWRLIKRISYDGGNVRHLHTLYIKTNYVNGKSLSFAVSLSFWYHFPLRTFLPIQLWEWCIWALLNYLYYLDLTSFFLVLRININVLLSDVNCSLATTGGNNKT